MVILLRSGGSEWREGEDGRRGTWDDTWIFYTLEISKEVVLKLWRCEALYYGLDLDDQLSSCILDWCLCDGGVQK
jgi:hypothetical protein